MHTNVHVFMNNAIEYVPYICMELFGLNPIKGAQRFALDMFFFSVLCLRLHVHVRIERNPSNHGHLHIPSAMLL